MPGAEDWPRQVDEEEQRLAALGQGLTRGGYYVQITDRVGTVRERRPPGVIGEEGQRSLEIVLALYRSAQTGQEVTPPLGTIEG